MSYEYNGPHNPKTVERLDRWVDQVGNFVSSISTKVGRKVDQFERRVDEWIGKGKHELSAIIADSASRKFTNLFGNFSFGSRKDISPIEYLPFFPAHRAIISSVSRFYSNDFEAEAQPDIITDYKKVLNDKKDPRYDLAQALKPWVEAFEKSKSKNPKELARLLEKIVKDPNFFGLIQPYLYEGEPYGRNSILKDFSLGSNKGLEVVAMVWKSGQGSPKHKHIDQNNNRAQGLDIVLRGNKGVEIRFTETYDKDGNPQWREHDRSKLIPLVANTIDDDLIHEVRNLSSTGEVLITLHIYWPPLKLVKAPVQGKALTFAESEKSEKKENQSGISRPQTDFVFSSLATFNYLTY